MKQLVHGKKLLSLLLACLMIVTLLPIGALAEEGDAPIAPPVVTEPPATEPPATEPPATEPPATEPPATEPPATEPPTTEPPASEPPASHTVPPTAEPPATKPPRQTPVFEDGDEDAEEDVDFGTPTPVPAETPDPADTPNPSETPDPTATESPAVTATPAPADVYADFDVTFDWQEGTGEASVRVTLRQSRNGGAYEDVDHRTVSYDEGSQSFHILQLDKDGNTYAYKLAVKASSGFIASLSGKVVTVSAKEPGGDATPSVPPEETPAPEEPDISARISEIVAAIVRLSAVDDVRAMTAGSDEFNAVKQAYEAVAAQLASLSDEQKLAVGSAMLEKIAALHDAIAAVENADPSQLKASPLMALTATVKFDASGGGIAPGSVQVWLERDDGVTTPAVTLTPTVAGASFVFRGLETVSSVDLHNFVYQVVVDTVAGYTITYSGLTATYTFGTPAAINMDYAVQWVNAAPAGASVTLGLYQYDPATGQVTLVPNQAITAVYPNTPGGTFTCATPVANGDYYIQATSMSADYVVELASIPNGTQAVVTYIGGFYTVQGSISWDDGGAVGSRPPVSVDLFYAGVGKENARGTNGDTRYAFPGRNAASEPDPNLYSIVGYAAGYTASYSGRTVDVANKTVTIHITFSAPVGFSLRFTVGWRDDYNKYERRPSTVTVFLYRDGVYTGRATEVTADGNWTGYFDYLDVRDGTHYYKYSVRQDKVPHYVTTYSRVSYYRLHIINTYSTERTSAPKVGDPLIFSSPAREAAYAYAAARMEALRAQVVRAAAATPADASIDFDTLKKTNRDICAWITIDGTNIDYPIVQGSNNSEYLTKLFSGETSGSGALFIDSNNRNNFTDRNTVIYGHNMNNGSMFAGLLDYQKQSFYDDHKIVMLYTPSATYEVEIFAGFFTDDAYANVSQRSFSGNSSYLSFLKTCINESDFQTDVVIDSSDKIVTFVTCSDDYDDGTRYLVMGKLNKLS